MKSVERPSNFSLYVARAMTRAYSDARRQGLSAIEASDEGVMVAEFIRSIVNRKDDRMQVLEDENHGT